MWIDKKTYWSQCGAVDGEPPSTKQLIRLPKFIDPVPLCIGVIDSRGFYEPLHRTDWMVRNGGLKMRLWLACADTWARALVAWRKLTK